MRLRAGSLNQLIRIERRIDGKQASGQPYLSWDLHDEVWANIRGQTGMGAIRQAAADDSVAASVNSYSFRIWYRIDLDVAMRVVLDGVPFEIRQIRQDLQRREWTDLVCEQGGSLG